MVPLFKSHFSIGKSILTIDKINELSKDLEETVLVEDSLSSLRKAKAKIEKPLRFGLRINCKHEGDPSKVILFAKNDEGMREIKKISTKAYCENEGVADFEDLKSSNIKVAIPFYDGFPHKIIHYFGNYYLPFEQLDGIVFFEEENGHPFDYQIKRSILKYCEKPEKAKSIFYEKKSDFPAFQCYKANCNKKMGRKAPTFDRPEIEGCSSDRFCWEDFINER